MLEFKFIFQGVVEDEDIEETGSKKKAARRSLQQFLLGEGSSVNHQRLTQKDLDDYIVEYLAECALPFNHVENLGFKKFVNRRAPGVTVETRKPYEQRMEKLFEEQKCKLKDNLAKAKRVCLTLDHWTAYRKGFLGVTAHWYGIKFKRRNACITLRRITGRCTYDVLANLIESIIAEYKVMKRVSHCVTDSVSNFVKAFAEFGHSTRLR